MLLYLDEAHYNLANLLKEQERVVESQKHYKKAIEINPNHAKAHCNLGILLKEQGDLDKSEKHYQKALEIDPRHMNAHYNLGALFEEKNQLIKAKKHYQKVLTINPVHISTQWVLSLLQLVLTDFKQGWQNYESRYHKDKGGDRMVPPNLSTSQYQGEGLQDKHLLIVPRTRHR